MHKTLLSLALALAAPLLVQAQTNPEITPPAATTAAMPAATDAPATDAPDMSQDLTVGFKVIGGVTTFMGNDADVLSRSIGNRVAPFSTIGTQQRVLPTGGAGFTANLKLGNKGWQTQTELLYILRGGQLRADTYVSDIYLHYVALPVLARFQQNRLYAEAGPQISYLISAQIEQNNQQLGATLTDDASSNRSVYNEVEWGYAAGVGYQSKSNIVVGVRYNGSLRPLLPKQAGNELKVYNAGIELHLGILFGKKRTVAAAPMAPAGGM